MSLLRISLRRVPVLMMMLQLVGNALLVLLGFAWLHIPDSHIWELIVSVLLGVLIVLGFLWMHATTIRRTRAPLQFSAKWLSILLLAAWLLVNHVLGAFAEHINNNADGRAGYWNSQLSAHMRVFFTYSRLLDWQNDVVVFLIYFLIPALLFPFLVETVACGVKGGAWLNALRCLFRLKYWVVTVIALAIVHFAGGWILGWHPLHTVSGELISVAFRVAVVYVIFLLAYFAALGTASELLERPRTVSSVRN
ncbi:MAG TPA: hypothetical protein VGN16_08300 [Acidobacteriaceae bacterium]|jgi:hypothetical protein